MSQPITSSNQPTNPSPTNPSPVLEPVLELLLSRRSVKPQMMTTPGPTADQLTTILTAAARVPDHKKLAPWRFVVFEGDARAKFGEVIAAALVADDAKTGRGPASPVRLDTERRRLTHAPTVVAVISRVVETPGAPEWEQVLSCGAACFNMCLAANALGFGSNWLTEWYSYNADVAKALGCAANERIAGFVHIGTASERQPDRDRPALSVIVSRWG
jgi:nitroreductase